jgi:hypothetical protein
LRFELSGDLPDLRGDPAALRILLREVISHRAAAFGGKDGALTIRTSRRQLPENDAGSGRYTGYAPDAGEYVELAIEDNAESLDDMRLETLFDPYQENSSGARGLSLAMVLGIVRSHQGGLAVTSAAHLGNTFTFLFPAFQDDNGIAIAPAVADVAARRSTLRLILLVSADLSLRNGLERALDDPALRVMAATDSTRAAALYAEFANSVELVVINSEPALDSESDLVAELLSRNARLPIIVIGGPGANFPTIWDVTYLSPSVALSEMAAAVHAALARNSSPGD